MFSNTHTHNGFISYFNLLLLLLLVWISQKWPRAHLPHNAYPQTQIHSKQSANRVKCYLCKSVSFYISWDHTVHRIYWIISTDMKWVFKLRSKQLKWKNWTTHIHTRTPIGGVHTNTHTNILCMCCYAYTPNREYGNDGET